ncbi:MAG: hypothetical protein WBZ36_28815 [Candidatus Nitrosopolaris sp.]
MLDTFGHKKAFFTVDGNASKSDLVDVLFNMQPKYLLVDEIEHLKPEYLTTLLSLMEIISIQRRRITQIISELDQLGLVTRDVVSKGRYGGSHRIKITVPTLTMRDAFKDDPSLRTWDLVD